MEITIIQFIKSVIFLLLGCLIVWASAYPVRKKYKGLCVENVHTFYQRFKLNDLLLKTSINKDPLIRYRTLNEIEFLALKDLEIARINFKDNLSVVKKMCSNEIEMMSPSLKFELVIRLNGYIKSKKNNIYQGVALLCFVLNFGISFLIK